VRELDKIAKEGDKGMKREGTVYWKGGSGLERLGVSAGSEEGTNTRFAQAQKFLTTALLA